MRLLILGVMIVTLNACDQPTPESSTAGSENELSSNASETDNDNSNEKLAVNLTDEEILGYIRRNEKNIFIQDWTRDQNIATIKIVRRGEVKNGYYPVAVRLTGERLDENRFAPVQKYDKEIYLFFKKDAFGEWSIKQAGPGQTPPGYD